MTTVALPIAAQKPEPLRFCEVYVVRTLNLQVRFDTIRSCHCSSKLLTLNFAGRLDRLHGFPEITTDLFFAF
jgi:hypothetical protein